MSEYLLPSGFKDEVTFNAYVEHQYKNKIIDYFKLNGFDLVKTPLIEFKDKGSKSNFLIQNKKKEEELQIRNDITPQIIRVASSRFINRKMPLKLCYYGEVVRKSGSMLRPERQFLQVGAETIGSNKIEADIEIINIEELIPFVVDRDFLDKNGLKSEEDLKNNLEKSIKSQYQNGLKQIEKKELMDILDKEHSFDLPQGILDHEFKDIWHRIEHAKKDGNLDEDDKKLNDNELKQRYEDISKRRVKLAILLQFIAIIVLVLLAYFFKD